MRNVLVVLSLLLALGSSSAEMQNSLEKQLHELDSLRAGPDTPLDEVDERGAKLLDEFTEPTQQAQIYYQLAHVHAQSGLKRPKQIVAYAQKALDSRLLTPEQRGALYSYLSSAHEVDAEEKEFSSRRQKALEPLLKGLAELKQFNLPEVAPEPAAIRMIEDGGPATPAQIEQTRRRIEAMQVARQQAERTRVLIERRKTHEQQVMYLYSREPVADAELRKAATKVLDEEYAQQLIDLCVEERDRAKPK